MKSVRLGNELQDSVQLLIPTLTQIGKQFDASHFEDGLYRFRHGDTEWLESESKDLKQWLKR